MSNFTLDNNDAIYQIRAFKPGMIQINDKIYTQSLVVAPNALVENWPPQTIEQLTAKHLLPLIAMTPHIVLIGTGHALVFPHAEIYGALINAGIGVEIMDTSAACRTYNALTSENRNVVAALIVN